MRVSYFYDLPVPSRFAAPLQILRTCRALCEHGAAVTVYTNRLTAPTVDACLAFYGLAPHANLRIVPIFAGRWSSLVLQRRLWRAVRTAPRGERHYVISRGEPGLALFDRLRRLERAPGQRHVYEAHRLCFTEVEAAAPDRPGLAAFRRRRVARVRALERLAVEGAHGLVCLTDGVRAALQREFAPTAPTLTLPSGVALPAREPPGDAARDIDILYAGKLDRRKGVHGLIAAMRFVPAGRLCVVGGTDRQVAQLARLADDLGVVDRVTFAGFVEPARIGALYARARVGVCPLPAGESRVAEEFTSPLKVLEMMAHGVAIAGTNLPSLRAILDHERTALLAPPGDPEALARAIRTLLADRGLAARLAHAAREEVVAYSWENRARRLLAFLDSLP